MEAATAEAAAKTATMEATAMKSAAEAPTGICRGWRKGTERGHRGEGNHRFTEHDNLLTQHTTFVGVNVAGHGSLHFGGRNRKLNSPARVRTRAFVGGGLYRIPRGDKVGELVRIDNQPQDR
jgi:hypothetical protein